MCNLNLVIKNDANKSKYDFTAFLMGVTSISYSDNRDGDGIYIPSIDKIIKGENKINLFKYKEAIEESNVLISHQRISTSGKTAKYTQPFMDNEIVLAHNGIITYAEKDGKSDTFVVFEKLSKLFKKKLNSNSDKKSREKLLIESLKEIFGEERGSWSIAVYDKKDKGLYYFKTTSTSINFYSFKDFLYITTNFSNKDLLTLLSKDTPKSYNIEAECLYKVSIINNKVKLYDLKEKIEPKPYSCSSQSNLTEYNKNRNKYRKERDNYSYSKTKTYDSKDLEIAEKDLEFGETYINDFNKELYLIKKGKESLEDKILNDSSNNLFDENDDIDFNDEKNWIKLFNTEGKVRRTRLGEVITIYNHDILKSVCKELIEEEEKLNELTNKRFNWSPPKKIISKTGRKIYRGYDDFENDMYSEQFDR